MSLATATARSALATTTSSALLALSPQTRVILAVGVAWFFFTQSKGD